MIWVGKAVFWRWVTVAAIFMCGIVYGYFYLIANRPKVLSLPVFGPPGMSGEHRVSGFRLVNHLGNQFTPDSLAGSVYVADFFFASCEGICPIMAGQMSRVADAWKSNRNVAFVSHTVKPEEDSLPVLKAYASSLEAENYRWYFVTGEKKVIDDLARNSYLVAGLGDTTGLDFIHTQYFALVDPEKRVRGLYDGTDSVEVNKLIDDIGLLIQEHRH